MELGLAGKVVVITGGATGIGKEAALAFLQEGCQVAVCSRSLGKVDSVVADCKAQGYEILGRQVDAASSAELSRFADEVAAAYGGIDIWLNNAGVYPQCPLLEMTEEAWDEIFRINVKGVFVGSRIAASHMACRPQGGVILNASSFAAVIPSAGSGAYAATKAAVGSLTRTLAAELAPKKIRVVAYIPGLIATEMTAPVIASKEQALRQQIALNRLGDAEEVAKPLVFLASEAASYITGVSVEISGGKFAVQNPMYSW